MHAPAVGLSRATTTMETPPHKLKPSGRKYRFNSRFRHRTMARPVSHQLRFLVMTARAIQADRTINVTHATRYLIQIVYPTQFLPAVNIRADTVNPATAT